LIEEFLLTDNNPLPQELNDLPPARQRHIRRQPKTASLAERQILIKSLTDLTSPNLIFLLLSLLSAIALGFALYFNQSALFILGIVFSPLLGPILGLALVPIHLNRSTILKTLVAIAVQLVLAFLAGMIAGWGQKNGAIDQLGLARFGSLYWLDLILLGVSTILAVIAIVRKGTFPRLIGVLLAYEIISPFALAGFALPIGIANFWPGALLVSLTYLCIAVFLAFMTYLALGLLPQKVSGWLFSLIPLALSMLMIVTGTNIGQNPSGDVIPASSATPQFKDASVTPRVNESPSATASEVSSPSSTPTLISTTMQTPRPQPSATRASTATATSFVGLVESASGVVVREQPNFQAEVIGYANNGDAIEILGETISLDGLGWYQVKVEDDQTGWIFGDYVTIPTTATRSP
jgi:hypothetical protein